MHVRAGAGVAQEHDRGPDIAPADGSQRWRPGPGARRPRRQWRPARLSIGSFQKRRRGRECAGQGAVPQVWWPGWCWLRGDLCLISGERKAGCGWRNKKMCKHPLLRSGGHDRVGSDGEVPPVRRRLAPAGSSAVLSADRVWSWVAVAVPEGAKRGHVAACNGVRVLACSPRRCRCLTACARVAAGHGQQGGLCC